jgi:hypothetical protein
MTGTKFSYIPWSEQTGKEKASTIVFIIGLINFAVFVAHVLIDKTSAFPGGGTFSNGVYFVFSHGKQIPFTPVRFCFSYAHGLLFIMIHVLCMFFGWRYHSPSRRDAL